MQKASAMLQGKLFMWHVDKNFDHVVFTVFVCRIILRNKIDLKEQNRVYEHILMLVKWTQVLTQMLNCKTRQNCGC